MNESVTRYRMTVIYRVPDVERWSAALQKLQAIEHDGLIGRWVYHAIDDPNEVMVDIVFASKESATSYLSKIPRHELREEQGLSEDFYPPVFIGVIDERLSYRATPM